MAKAQHIICKICKQERHMSKMVHGTNFGYFCFRGGCSDKNPNVTAAMQAVKKEQVREYYENV